MIDEIKSNHDSYKCYVCDETFISEEDWNEEKALIEFRKKFPNAKDCVLCSVCEFCYNNLLRNWN